MNLLNIPNICTPSGKPYPEYNNSSNIPILHTTLSDPYMLGAYLFAKDKYLTSGLSPAVKKMTITSAALVKDGRFIGLGCNGNGWHQRENKCVRIEIGCPPGEGYEECPGCQSAYHAERSAILNATEDPSGADLYLYGHWWICIECWAALTAHRIARIYFLKNSELLFDRSLEGCVIGTDKQYKV